jgi:hypothetical protein
MKSPIGSIDRSSEIVLFQMNFPNTSGGPCRAMHKEWPKPLSLFPGSFSKPSPSRHSTTPEFLSTFNTVASTETLPESKSIDCRDRNIALSLCEASGVFRFVFTDSGNKLAVPGPDREQRSRFQIDMISTGNPSIGSQTRPERWQYRLVRGSSWHG